MNATIRRAMPADLPAILDIYNDAVLHSTALWNDQPADLANRQAWYDLRASQNYPILVADIDGTVAGYASFGDFRPQDGFRITVEHSIYLAEAARGKGLGTTLVEALFPFARAIGKTCMVGAIDGGNPASIALHRKLGFVEVGRMPDIAEKFGRRLELVLMQKHLGD